MKRFRERVFALFLVLADLLCLNLALALVLSLPGNWRWFYSLTNQAARIDGVILFGLLNLTVITALALAGAYHTLRSWHLSETLVIVAKALLMTMLASWLFIFLFNIDIIERSFVSTTFRMKFLLAGLCLMVGITSIRLLIGFGQVILYRQGFAVRNRLIYGEKQSVHRLSKRLNRALWLGERTMSRLQSETEFVGGEPATNLKRIIEQHNIHVIWLAPPDDISASWLPSYLFDAGGARVIWRILPADFVRLLECTAPDLTGQQRAMLNNRLQHHLELPFMHVAMIGSRGIPANYGGVEKNVEEVSASIVRQGAKVTVYSHTKYSSKRGRYRGADLVFLPTISTKHLETIIHTTLSTCHALLFGVEIFHYHALGPTTLAWLPRLFGRKVVSTVHGLDWERAKWGRIARWYLRFGEWMTAKCPHKTVVVSQSLFRHYVERYNKRTVSIPNGFNPPVHRQASLIRHLSLTCDNYVLFVGRLTPEKGCHTLIRAFNEVATDKHLVLAGRASYDDGYFRQLKYEANGSNKIHFVGFVQGAMLQELYTNAYLVVHPSECEGLSLSLLEALSYHNCLLVSNIPENVEVLPSAKYTFRVGDVADLTKQLQLLFDNPERVSATRQSTQAQLDNLWPWEKVGQATFKVYQSLMQ